MIERAPSSRKDPSSLRPVSPSHLQKIQLTRNGNFIFKELRHLLPFIHEILCICIYFLLSTENIFEGNNYATVVPFLYRCIFW